MEKYNNYLLIGLSEAAKKKLPEILDEMGYKGRYTVSPEQNTLSINSTFRKVAEAFHKAEAAAHGEDGYLVKIAQTCYSTIWIPKEEAPSLKKAYEKVIAAVDNGWPVNQDPELSVGSAEDGERMRQEWELDYMPE